MMKKIFLVLGLSVLVLIILNVINIKSGFSFPVSDSAQISIKAGAGNLNFASSSSKSIISGYFNNSAVVKKIARK